MTTEEDVENVRSLILIMKDNGVEQLQVGDVRIVLAPPSMASFMGGAELSNTKDDPESAAASMLRSMENNQYAASGIVPPKLKDLRAGNEG